MKLAIVVLIFITIFLFVLAFRKNPHSKKEMMSNRIDRYVINPDKIPTENLRKSDPKPEKEKKKSQIFLNLDRTKKTVRKKLSKEKKNQLDLELQKAGLPLKPEEYIMFRWISTGLAASILLLITDNFFLALVGGFIGLLIPKMIIKKKQQDRLKTFNDGLPELISSIIGSLKAGFSFAQALKSYMEETNEPMKDELDIVLREMQYGVTMEDALHHLYERMPSDDLDLMIQAVLIQRQVGGNLATVLEKIVQTIRDRIKIQGQIRSLTAQGRLSGNIIGLLPVILGLALYAIQPGYISPMSSNPIGIGALIIGVISSIIGFFFVRKITNIEV